MLKFKFTIPLLLCCYALTAQDINYSLHSSNDIDYTRLQSGFVQPPPESRLRCYWWWLNSMATKESITRDLEEMKKNGYGGASIVDAGSSSYNVAARTEAGPPFMSPAWMELYRHAVKEAQRLGIELSVNTQSGWNPGGPTITPELAQKKIVFTETKVRGGEKIAVSLPQPASKLMYRDILVQAFPEPDGTPVKNDAIKNWKIKSFNESFGAKGTYPLYKLREEEPGAEKVGGIKTSSIINLTNKFVNGVLTWDVPEGEWTIIRYGWTCTGAVTSTNSDGWSGLSLDHLNANAFKVFSRDVILPLITNAQSAGNSLHFLQTDSWEMGNVGWTNDFPSEFKKFRGYNIEPYLPVLAGRIVENPDVSNRFLHDYRLTIGDCIAANHYRLFSNLAHQHGLGFHPESGGPHSAPVDALKVMAINDFPQGEFWATSNTHRVKDDERLAVKQSASVAHTNGKRFVAAEGPTSIGPQWERSPKDLKSNIDRVFCSGVNRIVWHTFTSSPKEFGLPGNEYFAGTHMNPNVTWWRQADNFIRYLNRCSWLLSKGLFVGDALYYYGDDVPNFVFLKEDIKDLAPGYDWDKCSKEALLKNASVVNDRLVFPDGTAYRLLVLPDEKAIDVTLLRKLETMVQQGLTLVGRKPLKNGSLSNYPENDRELTAIANRLWGAMDGVTRTENKYGRGKVVWGKDVNTVLREMKVAPDFSFKSSDSATALDYIHRTGRNTEIYFVANRFSRKGISDFEYRYLTDLPNRYENVECSFRVSGMVPELWDPVTGETSEIVVYREENGQTIIPLHFNPDGSLFIIFRKKAAEAHIVKIEKDGQSLFPGLHLNNTGRPFIEVLRKSGKIVTALFEPGNYKLYWSNGKQTNSRLAKPNTTVTLQGAWDIGFDTAWGGPAHITTDTLQSWTDFEDEGIKYYSGTAVYRKNFLAKSHHLKRAKVMLDLGNVLDLATVKINGHTLPVVWTPPFTADITAFIKPGNNTLEVGVTNLWPNCLIGDGKLPAEQRRTKTNIMKFNGPDAGKLLRASGLLGPVTLNYIHSDFIN
ncbi:glycosyl hydrolase [Agriterribacter sp.]|uniref:glycosyl hydrolase n=1 Tax=Agriterribacter sp. TaxID=2821509 RepID=UPI002BF64DED|nr:glycosyl hydrolase [Agriterribacter sp.]HRP56452.1 glycosyl hydrolase [Agriterribacter sp.]